MIHLNIVLTVKDPAEIPTVRDHLRRQGQLSRAEPGCERFEVYQSESDPRVFILNEWWESAAALDAHRGAKAYNEVYKPHVLPRVDRVPHPSRLVE